MAESESESESESEVTTLGARSAMLRGVNQPMRGPPNPGPFGPPIPVAQPVTPASISVGPALILGLLVAMFCGCLPGGIIAMLLADQAKKAAARGNYAEAQSRLRLSYVASAASIGLLVLGSCLWVGITVLNAGLR